MIRGLCLAALLCAPFAANAASVFSEDFEGEAASSSLNYNSFAQFTVTDGTVDLIRDPNQWGITCTTPGSACVDLDGSTGNAGVMTSIEFDLVVGNQYTLTFDISGNQRRSAADTMDFGLVSGALTDQLTLASDAPWQEITRTFVATAAKDSLFFGNLGGDNIGMVLDNVRLSAVPLPAGILLLGTALGGLAFSRRRRQA